jgi:hypothetical protein
VRRAGQWPKQQARRDYVAFLGEVRWPVAGIAGVVLAANAALVQLLPPFLAGITIGTLNASAAWWIALLVIQMTGSSGRWMGGQGEEWTAAELGPLRKAGWRCVDHVVLQRGDVDHVVIGPAGVFAIETKWSGATWRAEGDWRLDRVARAARVDARAVRLRLRQDGCTPDVAPVIVLWGRHDDTSRVVEQGSTTILHGTHLATWLQSQPATILATDEVQASADHLMAHLALRDAHHDQAAPTSRFVEVGAAGVAMDIVWAVLAACVTVVGLVTLWTLVADGVGGAAALGVVVITATAVAVAAAMCRGRRRWLAPTVPAGVSAASGGIAVLFALSYVAAHAGWLS